MDTNPASKSFLKSKTFWLNALAVVSTLIPAVGEWVEANPVEILAVLAAVNVLLRFVTSGKISLGWDSDGASGKASGLLLALGCTGLAVSGFSLTSCSHLPEGMTGSIYYLDSNTGAKGGLNFRDGKGTVTVLVPIVDPETGESKGRAELTVPIDATK